MLRNMDYLCTFQLRCILLDIENIGLPNDFESHKVIFGGSLYLDRTEVTTKEFSNQIHAALGK